MSSIRYFEEGKGKTNKFQLESLFAYWAFLLCLSELLKRWVTQLCFSLAIVAKGKSLALAPLYLGSLYEWLDESGSLSLYDVVTCADTAFLQMFVGEKFRVFSEKPIKFDAIKPEMVVVRGVRTEKPPNISQED